MMTTKFRTYNLILLSSMNIDASAMSGGGALNESEMSTVVQEVSVSAHIPLSDE